MELGPRAPVLVLFCIPAVTGLCSSVLGSRIPSSIAAAAVGGRTFLTSESFRWTAGGAVWGWINQGFTVTGSRQFLWL